jgi:hypothetical protein
VFWSFGSRAVSVVIEPGIQSQSAVSRKASWFSIIKAKSNAYTPNDKIIRDMNHGAYPEQIERMFDAMLCLPRTAWGLLLREVEKKIGADALHKIIVRVFEETDRGKLEEFKRALAVVNREKRKQQERKKKNLPQRNKRA